MVLQDQFRSLKGLEKINLTTENRESTQEAKKFLCVPSVLCGNIFFKAFPHL